MKTTNNKKRLADIMQLDVFLIRHENGFAGNSYPFLGND